jgi:hypothetical protein
VIARTSRRLRVGALFTLSYLAVSLVVLWPLVRSGALHHSVWIEDDASLPIWANGWVAHAVAHLQNPFFYPGVWSPRGLNLLANTTAVGLALAFTPLTWLFGPVGAFNAQLVAVPVLGALAMALAARPWLRHRSAIWLAGAAWGFSPLMLQSAALGWTNFEYLATPPLVFWLLCDLLHFRRHSPRSIGLALSIVLSVQLMVGSEILAIVVLVSSTVLLAGALVTSLLRRAWLSSRLRRVAAAVAWSAPVLLLVALPLALYAVDGPAHLPDWVYPRVFFASTSIHLGTLVSQEYTRSTLPHWHGVVDSSTYFGPVLLAAAAIVVLARRREPIVLVLAGVVAASFWLALGADALGHPWTLLWKLPVVHNVGVGRCVVVAWFGVVLLVALGADRLASARVVRGARWRAVAPWAFVLAAFAQLVAGDVGSLAIVPQSITGDGALGALTSGAHEARLAIYPFPGSGRGLIEQATGGFRFELLGGWGAEYRQFSGSAGRLIAEFTSLSVVDAPQLNRRQLRAAGAQLRRWRLTAAVVPVEVRYELDRGYGSPAALTATFTELYGAPRLVDNDWVWRPGPTGSARPVAPARWLRCVTTLYRSHPGRVPACIERGVSRET